MDEFEKFTIEHAYQTYSNWMNCPEFGLDDRILSVLAYSIDAYALATLLNFIDKNDEMVRKLEGTNLLLIRMYALVTAELIDYLTYINQIDISQYEEPNNYKPESVKLSFL